MPKEMAHRAALQAKYAQEVALEAERELVVERGRRQDAEQAASQLRNATLQSKLEEGRAAAMAEEASSRLAALENRLVQSSARKYSPRSFAWTFRRPHRQPSQLDFEEHLTEIVCDCRGGARTEC